MPFDLSHFNDSQLDTEYVTRLIDQPAPQNEALHNRLWDDYRTPLIPSAATRNGRPSDRVPEESRIVKTLLDV